MMNAKRFFFTSAAVIKDCDRKTRSVLSKFGAFVRRTAKGSIRKAKKPARPGSPPHDHGGPLKRLIFFVWEAARRSVIIGPERLRSKEGDAPHALEHGGQTTSTRKVRVGRSSYRATRKVTIAAHPYMGPAAAKESKKLPDLWSNSVKS
jgi:hypothetical protein